MLLSSLIQHFYPGKFHITSSCNGNLATLNRPESAVPNRSASGTFGQSRASRFAAKAVATEVLSYLQDQAKPCTIEELVELIGGRLPRYSLYEKRCLGDKNKVLWYTLHSMISRQALDWSAAKQAAIENLAARHLEERETRGIPFGLCSEICRDMASHLPDLAGDISWTPVLLHDLLCSNPAYIRLGDSKNILAWAHNSHGLWTLDDLIYYLLRTEHGGAAPRVSFVHYLQQAGVIRNMSRGFFSGKDNRVVIDGDVIRIADL
jgi:hypothetical protein